LTSPLNPRLKKRITFRHREWLTGYIQQERQNKKREKAKNGQHFLIYGVWIDVEEEINEKRRMKGSNK